MIRSVAQDFHFVQIFIYPQAPRPDARQGISDVYTFVGRSWFHSGSPSTVRHMPLLKTMTFRLSPRVTSHKHGIITSALKHGRGTTQWRGVKLRVTMKSRRTKMRKRTTRTMFLTSAATKTTRNIPIPITRTRCSITTPLKLSARDLAFPLSARTCC